MIVCSVVSALVGFYAGVACALAMVERDKEEAWASRPCDVPLGMWVDRPPLSAAEQESQWKRRVS
jgi:hypothetical protein